MHFGGGQKFLQRDFKVFARGDAHLARQPPMFQRFGKNLCDFLGITLILAETLKHRWQPSGQINLQRDCKDFARGDVHLAR